MPIVISVDERKVFGMIVFVVNQIVEKYLVFTENFVYICLVMIFIIK